MYTVLAFLNIRWERGRRETRKREVGMLVDGPTDHTLQNLCSKLLSEKLLHSNPLSYTGVHLHSLHNTLNLDFDSDLSQRPPFHSHRNQSDYGQEPFWTQACRQSGAVTRDRAQTFCSVEAAQVQITRLGSGESDNAIPQSPVLCFPALQIQNLALTSPEPEATS